jgi:phosphopantetheinyl transferase
MLKPDSASLQETAPQRQTPQPVVVSHNDIAHLPPATYLTTAELAELREKDTRKHPGYLASRYAVKQAVQTLQPTIHMRDITTEHTNKRVPIVTIQSSPWHLYAVSLSHSGIFGAAVITHQPGWRVGVDIERIRTFHPHTLKAFLTDREYNLLMQPKPSIRPFLATLLWSCKEAYLKARGVGLRQHPKTLTVTPCFTQNTWHITDNHYTHKETGCWTTTTQNYVLAIARIGRATLS